MGQLNRQLARFFRLRWISWFDCGAAVGVWSDLRRIPMV